MKIYKTRNDLLDDLPKNMSVVELGVFKGEFATEMYNRLKPSQLYLVDIWEGEFGSGDKDGNNHVTVRDMNEVYREILNRYKDDYTVNVKRCSTTDFLQSCQNDTFDMVYVDADHSYEAVTSDLQLSFNKLRDGGILAGHDYIIGTRIAAAVDNFCLRYKQAIISLTEDGCPTFAIRVDKSVDNN